MSVADLAESTGEVTLVRKERSLWEESLIRLLKNKVAVGSGIFLIFLTLVAIFPDFFAPYDFAEQDLLANNAVPEWMLFLLPEGAENYANLSDVYPLGADHLGRDTAQPDDLWRARFSGGCFCGGHCQPAGRDDLRDGFRLSGGRVDDVMMRLVDFLYAFPFLVVVILLQTYFKALARRGGGEGIGAVLINLKQRFGRHALSVHRHWLDQLDGDGPHRPRPGAGIKEEGVCRSGPCGGGQGTRIIMRHLLPNVLGPLIVAETLAIPGYIFTEAFLSFIGLGVDPPTPSWGIMISEAVQALRTYPNQVLVPAVALSMTTLAFNFLGDGLRDAFDPRLKE